MVQSVALSYRTGQALGRAVEGLDSHTWRRTLGRRARTRLLEEVVVHEIHLDDEPLTPLWFITLNWIGKTDPFLVGVSCLCWAYAGRWRIALRGEVLGRAHPLLLAAGAAQRDWLR